MQSLKQTSFTLVVCAAFVMVAGCISMADKPRNKAVATGEALNVVDDVKVWTTQHREKVGETEYKDDSGRTFAKADVYQNRTQTHAVKVWYPVQGAEQLTDEEFFRIAGAQREYDATLAMRRNGAKWQKRGVVTAIAGGVGIVGGWLLPMSSTLKMVASLGGALGVSAGYMMMRYGDAQMSPDHHAIERSEAMRAAEQYNRGRGSAVGISLSGKF